MVRNHVLILIMLLVRSIHSNSYSITLVDENMNSANYIRPLVVENSEYKGYLFIITGETANEDFQPGEQKFKRYILEYDNEGRLYKRQIYNTIYPFRNGEIFFDEDMKYIIITTICSFEIFNNINNILKEYQYSLYGYRRTLKKANSYYYYAHIQYDERDNMIINKIEIINNLNSQPSYNIIKTSNPVKVLYYQAFISCEITKNNEYILCAYFNPEKYVSLSIFDNELNLIQTEKYEIVPDANPDYFIKIVINKYMSQFILFNSQSDYVTRIRFFTYINDKIISLLYPIIANGNDYLDVSDTQLNPGQYNNDIIVIDFNKIIKISVDYDSIFISIFTTYNYYNIMQIKKYTMLNYENIGFNSFTQPRLAAFRGTYMVGISTKYNHQEKQSTGFLFLNYPKSKDIKIDKLNNKIKINELISIENNIFSLNLKFKILKIPDDFIFLNSKSEIIEDNDLLDLEDELEIKQYRINGGPFILKYVGETYGKDNGYFSEELYPSGVQFQDLTENIIEGRIGELSFDFWECSNGYYHLDYDLNICSSLKPEKYYIDEENKIYKKCQSPCDDCNGPMVDESMNCITCKENFYMTEDTNSCYKEKENYYLDNNVLKRCHPRCSKCISIGNDENMNCLECIYDSENNLIYKEDTLNCIYIKEFKKRDYIELSIPINYVFYIFIGILISSIIFSIIIFLSLICKNEIPRPAPDNNNINNDDKKKIELPEYHKINDEENEEDYEEKKVNKIIN